MLGDWLQNASAGKLERLGYIASLLGLHLPLPDQLHYQLLHRTAAAIIEARRFKTDAAAMVVHSFSPTAKWYDAFGQFAEVLGVAAERERLFAVPGVVHPLYIGWAMGEARFLTA